MSPALRASLAALLAALLALLATRMRVSSDLAEALPQGGEIGHALRDLSRFSMMGTVLVEVDGTGASEADLVAATDALADAMVASGDFVTVNARFGLGEGAALAKAAAPHVVLLSPPAQLSARLSPAGMATALQGQLDRLLSPASALFAGSIESDPLDLVGSFTRGLAATAAPQGAVVRAGHLMAADGQHMLIVARAKSPPLGTTLESPLVRNLEAALAASPLPAVWLGSHRFAAEARAMIQGEVNRALGAGTLLVGAVFLLAFRSLRPILGALPVLLLGAAAAGAMAALRSPIHGLALAFGGALGGMGVDYWTHLYLHGVRGGVPATFARRLEVAYAALQHLVPAYAISVGATTLAFGLLATSSYAAVADLAWIGFGTVVGAVTGTVLAGPVVFAALARPGDRVPALPVPRRLPGWLSVLLLGVFVALGLAATGVRYDGDPRSLDARRPETAALERALLERYTGRPYTGLVVAEADTLDLALDRLAESLDHLEGAPGLAVRSPLALLPPPSRAAAARALLEAPDLESRFVEAASSLGFSPESLLPGFRRSLEATAPVSPATWDGTPVAELVAQTVWEGPEGYAVAAILSSRTPEALEHASVEMQGAPARFVVATAVAAEGAERIRHELLTRSGLGVLLVLGFMVLRYRDLPRVFAATLPCLAAAAGTFGVMALLDIPLTPVSGPAFVLVLGIAFDQGIFLVEADAADRETLLASRAAIFVALAAAMAGFVGLCVAQHPAVLGVGVVVSLGILFTALAVFVVLPGLLSPEGLVASRIWGRRLGFVAVVALGLDALLSVAGRLAPPPLEPDTRGYAVEQISTVERRFGPNRLLRTHGLWALSAQGSATEIGRARARLLERLDAMDEAALVREFAVHVPSPLVRGLLIRGVPLLAGRMARAMDPAHLEELAAFSETLPDRLGHLQPSYTRRLCYHAIHDLGQAMVDSPLMACTGFAAGGARTADGHWLLARNFDFDGGRYFDEDKVVMAIARDGAIPFVHVAIGGLAGAVSGLNAEGIAVSLFAAASDDPIRPATPMIFVAREILESARSLDDARRILERRKGFVSENVLVVDGDAGEAALFEVTPARVEVLPVDGALAVSNHFRSPALADHEMNRQRLEEGTTAARLARMEELIAAPLSVARSVEILRDRAGLGGASLPRGHESSINADIASHGLIIDASARTLAVSVYPNLAGGFVQFDLRDMLNGELEGQLLAGPDQPDATLEVHEARRLVALAREQDPEDAAITLAAALTLNPGDVRASIARAAALIELQRLDEARPLLESALATPPAHAAEQREAERLLERSSP